MRSRKRQDAHYHQFNIFLEALTRAVKIKKKYKIHDLDNK